jgi:hypothetical protein
MRIPSALAPTVIALLAGAAASAQEAVFLSPQSFVIPGGQARVQLLSGQPAAAAATPWTADRTKWLFSRSAGAQDNLHDVAPAAADDFLAIPAGKSGVTVIGLDLAPQVLEFTADEWQKRASAMRPAGAPLENRSESGKRVRVRHLASAKALLRAGAAQGPDAASAEAMSKTGQAAEIRPLFDPTVLRVGADLPLAVYADNIKRKDIRVAAASVQGGTVEEIEIGSGGLANLTLTHPGIWRIAFQVIEPAPKVDSDVDWIVYSGTLTFEVQEAGK